MFDESARKERLGVTSATEAHGVRNLGRGKRSGPPLNQWSKGMGIASEVGVEDVGEVGEERAIRSH